MESVLWRDPVMTALPRDARGVRFASFTDSDAAHAADLAQLRGWKMTPRGNCTDTTAAWLSMNVVVSMHTEVIRNKRWI